MKKLKKYEGIQIFIDEDFGMFYFKIADREFKETSLNIAQARVDEQLKNLNPIKKKCIQYSGWSSSNIKEVIIVRKTEDYAFDEEGNRYDLSDLYECSKNNLKLVERFKEENARGWRILRASERIGKSMNHEEFKINITKE